MLTYFINLFILFGINCNCLLSLSIDNDSNNYFHTGVIYPLEKSIQPNDLAKYTRAQVQWLDGSWVVSISCTFDDENAEVTWHFQEITSNGTGTLIKIDDQFVNRNQSSSSIALSGITMKDIGSYLCLIALPSGYSNQIFFTEAEPIINDGNDNEISVTKGDLVEINCTSFNGSQLYWRLPLMKSFYKSLSESSYENEINSTITISFLADFNQSSDHYQCCSQSNLGFPSYCKTFSVLILDAPIEVSLAIQSGSQIGYCRLACTFNSYPIVKNESVVWTRQVLGESVSNIDDYLYYTTETIGNYTFRSSMIIGLDPTPVTYTCSAANSYTIGSDSFQMTKSVMYAPIPDYSETFGKLHFEDDSYSASLYCAFSANSEPNIKWERQVIGGASDGWESIVDDGYHFVIDKKRLQTMTYISILNIFDYDEGDNANYFCVAWNQMGEAISSIIQPRINIGEIELSLTNSSTIVYPEDLVEIRCLAYSFPPPKIIWNVIAEFDLDFTIELNTDWTLGNSSSIIRFEADYYNSFVTIECLVYSELNAEDVRSNQLTIDIYHEPEIIDTKSCKENFMPNSNCTLECQIQASKLDYLLNWDWRYFINSSIDFVSFTEGKSLKQISPYKWKLQLTIQSYNAWNYECWTFFSINDTTMDNYRNLSNVFKINPIDQYIELGETCEYNQDCATLNANCVDQQCECSSPFDVPFDDGPLTLECLTAVAPGGVCLNSAQCAEGDDNYYCDLSRTCKCGGVVMSIESIGNKDECIKKVVIDGTCRYDEECILADTNTYCSSGKCACVAGYIYDDYSKYCILESGKMSTAAIVIITVTCCFLVLIAITFTIGYVRRRRQKKSPQTINRDRSKVISEISGTPYNHHSPSKNTQSADASDDDDVLDRRSLSTKATSNNVLKIIEEPVNNILIENEGAVIRFSSPVSTPNDDLNVHEAIAAHHSGEISSKELAVAINEVTTEDSMDHLPGSNKSQTLQTHEEINSTDNPTENLSKVEFY